MRRLAVLLAFTVLIAFAGSTFAATPHAGEAAPAFHLQDQNGHWRSLDNFRGNWRVMYFYPKDFSPGCTTQVCTFRDDVSKLRKAGASVVGLSLDDVKSHAEFAQKYHVPFPLLADMDRQVATRYGVLVSRLGFHFAKRTTFLIDPQGRIAKVYLDVDPEKNSAQVLVDPASVKTTQ